MTAGGQSAGGGAEAVGKLRPVLHTLARVIASDHRAVVLGSSSGEILLANAAAQRLGLDDGALTTRLDWAGWCRGARRAGSLPVQMVVADQRFDGELVYLPLGPGHGFLLRLAEADQEATWLRNRARAAALMRVAHDLRTPIQSLLASVDGLLAGQDPATGEGLRRAAGQALDHVNRVLAMLGGDGAASSDQDFRIVDELRQLVALVQPIAAARATELALHIDAPEDLTLHGPQPLLRALCQNMIDNSVNHGGGRVVLHLSCRRLHDDPLAGGDPGPEQWGVVVDLRDEGGGMPQAQRDRLAAAFGDMTGQRPTLSVKGQRVSAGIEVMAHALRQLGGRLEIADRGPDGAPIAPGDTARVIGTVLTARFSLPRATDMHPQAVAAPVAGQPLSGRRILLVEDSPASRDWLCHVLHGLGAEVAAAGSAPEALALLARPDLAEGVHLVLTDVTLPRMNGIEFARRLRDGDPAAPIRWQGPVVGLTAHVDQRIRAACLDAGMIRVLEKPITPADLATELARILAEGDTAPPVVDADIAGHLAQELGGEAARTFMLRALSEARGIAQALRHEGVGSDTGRQLHAATGAAGLTGLRLVERSLRRIELAIGQDQPWDPLLTPLERAIDRTVRGIEGKGA